MATRKYKYSEKMLETTVNHSSEKLQQTVNKLMAETEEEERNAKHNANNVDMDTLCQSPFKTNTKRKITNVTNVRQISLEILAETI